MELWWLLPTFFVIATLYASVGFGGGSSYIAILSLCMIPFAQLRTLALLCNIIVVTINFIKAVKNKTIDWRTTLIICSLSIPMAYIGSQLPFKEVVFFKILGITLVIASLIMLIETYLKKKEIIKELKNPNIIVASIGSGIGLLSGITGIGGGIFLSPILYLIRYPLIRYIPSLCSIFILVNSVSGLYGLIHKKSISIPDYRLTIGLLVTVLIGAFLGNKIRFQYFTANKLRMATAILVLIAGIRLLLK